jgi:hypothetical protein
MRPERKTSSFGRLSSCAFDEVEKVAIIIRAVTDGGTFDTVLKLVLVSGTLRSGEGNRSRARFI